MRKAPGITLVMIALAFAACAGAAHAQAQPSSGFRAADANGDNIVTRAEYDAAIGAAFVRVDVNHDNQFSLTERVNVGGGPPAGGGADPDANADGFVTRAEYDAFHGARFTRLDRNDDGRLTPDELGAPQRVPTAARAN